MIENIKANKIKITEFKRCGFQNKRPVICCKESGLPTAPLNTKSPPAPNKADFVFKLELHHTFISIN